MSEGWQASARQARAIVSVRTEASGHWSLLLLTAEMETSMTVIETLYTRFPPLLGLARKQVATWKRNRRTRRHLADLPPWLLKDVGITPRQAREEARRFF